MKYLVLRGQLFLNIQISLKVCVTFYEKSRLISIIIKINQKMEVINQRTMRADRQLLVITHLTQLLNYVIGFGGLITPLILWLTSKDSVESMDEHGKAVLNLQLSLLLYIVLSIPAILLFGLGIITLIGTGILGFVLPIVNAVRASNGESPSYFMTINFLA
jgi:uncharacterized Tic20 family protein